MYQRILVALDGSDLAERVLPYVESLAIQFGSTVVFLRTVAPPGAIIAGSGAGADPVAGPIVDATPIVDAERQEATSYLRSVAQRLRDAGVETELDVLEGRPAPTIVGRSTELGIDLIAMTTHGRGGLRRLVMGSVAEEVLRHASCPILLVRASMTESPPASVRQG
jgi:nucleotide-binding universal stress UspA family protein